MKIRIFVLVILLVNAPKVHSDRWFMFRLLRNAGLENALFMESSGDCIELCRATAGCSAISYQYSTGTCVKSLCNNLDLYKSTGWNSFVIG